MGDATFYGESDIISSEGGDIIHLRNNGEALSIATIGKVLQINLQNGFRIFRLEKLGLDDRPIYQYLITDERRQFLGEVSFSVEKDRDRFSSKMGEILNTQKAFANN
jgi:hypothetical protein